MWIFFAVLSPQTFVARALCCWRRRFYSCCYCTDLQLVENVLIFISLIPIWIRVDMRESIGYLRWTSWISGVKVIAGCIVLDNIFCHWLSGPTIFRRPRGHAREFLKWHEIPRCRGISFKFWILNDCLHLCTITNINQRHWINFFCQTCAGWTNRVHWRNHFRLV